MNRTDAPKKQPVPFGTNGSREDLLETTPAGDNQASYDAGFPPVTMILKAAGGLPPKGQDMNQILYELSAIGRWLMAGALNSYDAAFATAIGGYPKGSMVLGDDGTTQYFNNTESNTTNPNTGGAGWTVQSGNFQPLNANLTALSGLVGAANKLPYFTAAGAMTLADLTAVGRDLINKASVAAMRTYLELGSAATANVGTGANQIPDMNSFTSLLSATQGGSGWMKFPGGLIIQWYTAAKTGAGAQTFNFPIPFPNAFLSDSVTAGGSGGNVVNGGNVTKTSREFYSNAALSISVISVGW